jgi:hypothetical protein
MTMKWLFSVAMDVPLMKLPKEQLQLQGLGSLHHPLIQLPHPRLPSAQVQVIQQVQLTNQIKHFLIQATPLSHQFFLQLQVQWELKFSSQVL